MPCTPLPGVPARHAPQRGVCRGGFPPPGPHRPPQGGFLFRGRMKENGFWDQHVPQPEKLDMISYRSVSLGMLFLTLTILTGAIWAEQAWGSYWSWDPKETWSLVTWIIYAVYLHLRLRRGWKGKAAAWFAVIGFICVIFTYIGVNTFLPGIHSYA